MQASVRDLEWAAGFLEGEGSFSLQWRTPAIVASQCEMFPLYRLQRIFGGKIYPVAPQRNKLGKKLAHVWQRTGGPAVQIMMTLYGLMSPTRQAQIRKALAMWKSVKPMIVVQDAAAREAIKRVYAGDSITAVAKDIGVTDACLGYWVRGQQRSHLLIQLRQEGFVDGAWSLYRKPFIHDDEVIRMALVRIQNGESINKIASDLHVGKDTIHDWIDGKRRGHVVEQMQREGQWAPLPPRRMSDAKALSAMRQVKAGHSMSEVARNLGVTISAVSLWMAGKARPHLLAQLQGET